MTDHSVDSSHQWTLTTLTPLHIGTTETVQQYEYVHDKKDQRLYILDLDKVAGHRLVDPEELAEKMQEREFSIREFLDKRGIDPEEVMLYSVHCDLVPRGGVRAFIKHLYQSCYVPGTTLKGAIRTALLWKMLKGNSDAWRFVEQYLRVIMCARSLVEYLESFRENASDPEIQLGGLATLLRISKDDARPYLEVLYKLTDKDLEAAWAGEPGARLDLGALRNIVPSADDAVRVAQPVEKLEELFGPEPHLDLLRALHVADSELLDASKLNVTKVDVYDRQDGFGKTKTLLVEVIPPGEQLGVSLKVDRFLFSCRAEKKLGFSDRRHYIEPCLDFFAACNEFASWLLEEEGSFYREVGCTEEADFTQTADWCSRRAEEADRLSDACLLPIGWGTGWRAKTIGRGIQTNMRGILSWLHSFYELSEGNPDTFPISRRLTNICGRPLPTGWIKLSR